MRRTELKRGTSQLKRSQLNQVSSKRRAENRVRTGVLADKRATGQGCEAKAIKECTNAMDDGHEIVTRGRGGSITDSANVITVCRTCHSWISEHPKEASCMGLVIPSWVGASGLEEARAVRQLRAIGNQACPWWCSEITHTDQK